jgi:pyruvate dehydrogenase complex dehydrogenase (E1) component
MSNAAHTTCFGEGVSNVSNGFHAVVWISHAEAKIYRFSGDKEVQVDLHSHTSLQRLHHSRTGWEAGGNPPDDTEFFERINAALEHAEGTVITGPGNAKSALKAFLDHARPNVASHVLALETLDDHPAADTLLALGRRYFVSADPILSAAEKSRALP